MGPIATRRALLVTLGVAAVVAGLAACPTDWPDSMVGAGPSVVPVTQQSPQPPQPPQPPALLELLGDSESGPDPTVTRRRLVRIRTDLISPGAAAAPVVGFAPFPDVKLQLEFERFDQMQSGAVWIGHVSGFATGTTVLIVGDIVTGNIRAIQRQFRLRTLPSGEHVVEEVNAAAFPPY